MDTIKVYSASELKEEFQDAFEKAMEKYHRDISNDRLPWQDEIMDSMKSTFKNAGVDLKDWEISDSSPSYVKFTIPTYWSELAEEDSLVDDYTGRKALNWLKKEFELKSVKRVNYIGHDKKKHFRYDVTKLDGKDWSGEFTGYCADHDFLDSLLDDVTKGNCTLSEAFHNLADVAGKLFENEYEYAMSEEYFLEEADINDYKFTEDGIMV